MGRALKCTAKIWHRFRTTAAVSDARPRRGAADARGVGADARGVGAHQTGRAHFMAHIDPGGAASGDTFAPC
jgi:hypothetical protein